MSSLKIVHLRYVCIFGLLGSPKLFTMKMLALEMGEIAQGAENRSLILKTMMCWYIWGKVLPSKNLLLRWGKLRREGLFGGLVVVVPKFTHNVRFWSSVPGNK